MQGGGRRCRSSLLHCSLAIRLVEYVQLGWYVCGDAKFSEGFVVLLKVGRTGMECCSSGIDMDHLEREIRGLLKG